MRPLSAPSEETSSMVVVVMLGMWRKPTSFLLAYRGSDISNSSEGIYPGRVATHSR